MDDLSRLAVDSVKLPPVQPYRGHLVQFYEEDSFLVSSVARLIGEGLEAGEGGVVIASAAHLSGIERALTERGLDLDALGDQTRYIALDAAWVLSLLMTDGMPDEDRFRRTVGDQLARVVRNSPRGCGRAFGEMVALLWAWNNTAAAAMLEDFWNRLMETHAFSLYCAYPLQLFSTDRDGAGFARICSSHTHVLPTESYAALQTDEARLRSITSLQHRARMLEVETASRRQAEHWLGLRERELSEFLENAAEGIHSVGADGRILWANRAQLELLGFSAGEYVGRHVATLFAQPEVFEQFWNRTMAAETVYDFPAALRCRNGALRQVLIHSNGLWQDGRFVSTRCFIRDVTDRLKLEEELKRRLAELAEADRQKNEFLAMLGHELRNPLSAVLNALASTRRNGQVSESALEIACRQAGQLARLVDDLLDIARITQGRISLRKQSVVLGSVVQRVAEDARYLADSRRHQLVLSIEPEVRVDADPARLGQVVHNLIDNAVKYTAPGGRIDVAVTRTSQEAVLRVRDSGIGIAPDLLPRVFDLFTQAERPLDRAYSGLGVGLTLVKRLVEMHGGRVTARSEGNGHGAEFEVRLPALSNPHDLQPAPREQADKAGGLRVLVVDDNPDVCESLTTLLELFGHRVQAAADGPSALQLMEEAEFDAVLIDIGLPGLDGYEVARRIRARSRGSDLLLAAVTGYGREEDRRRAFSAGFNYHLTKPVDIERLQAILDPASKH